MPQSTEITDEKSLIRRVIESTSQNNWLVGECAAIWTDRFSSGRTDADFAKLVDLTVDQIQARRRVYDRFGGDDSVTSRNAPKFKSLSWSHFHASVAVSMDEATEQLQWAAENEASVSQMRAWRRMQNGDDLTLPPPEPSVEAVVPPPEPSVEAVVPTPESVDAETDDPFEIARRAIMRIRTSARQIQRLDRQQLTTALADDLAAVLDDLAIGREVSGLDQETLSAALNRPKRRLELK